jgi:hypothetical protein
MIYNLAAARHEPPPPRRDAQPERGDQDARNGQVREEWTAKTYEVRSLIA